MLNAWTYIYTSTINESEIRNIYKSTYDEPQICCIIYVPHWVWALHLCVPIILMFLKKIMFNSFWSYVSCSLDLDHVCQDKEKG